MTAAGGPSSKVEIRRRVLTKQFHDERAAKGSQRVDCWVCEVMESYTLAMVLDEMLITEQGYARAHEEIAALRAELAQAIDSSPQPDNAGHEAPGE